MKKNTLWIIIGAVVLVIIIIFLVTRPKKVYNNFEFPTTIVVKNSTSNKMADTITMVLINKVMGYDTMQIDIFPMPPMFNTFEMTFVGMIVKVDFQPHRYIFYVQNNVDVELLKSTLSHELWHLKQMESGDLIILGNDGYMWKGETYKFVNVPYDNRPQENEAFSNGPMVLKELNKILYK